MTRPADWSDQTQSDSLSDQVRAKVVCYKPLTTLLPDQWLLNHQNPILSPYGLQPTGGVSYSSVEVQSAYSTAPADRGNILQIWPPATTGCLQDLKRMLQERDLAPWKSEIWNWSIFWGLRQIILQKSYHPRRRLYWILPKCYCFIS